MGETEEFNTLAFEKKLMQLKDTQESIQSLSSWCLKQRSYHKKIVSSWLNVLKRVKVEQRLVLFYLANDVIQYSKRKNYEFVESWGLNLQKATPLVRDEKVRSKILRIFKIWEQRSVYDDEFLSDLTGLLSAGAVKKADDDPLDFQPQQLVNKIKQCTVLEADTDMRLKCIHDSHLQLSDADALCSNLKDRSLKDDVEKELNEGIACVERYTQALQREIVAREALLALLTSANQYYSTQRGEVKVVAHAYKNFGARVRALKRKLDELIPTLPNAAPSPPERDEDVPSPGPDEDLDLPASGDNNDDDLAYNIDQSFNTTLGADGSLYNLGLSSFLTSDNPLAIFNESTDLDVSNANKIEVINSRPNEKQDFNINDFLKTFAPNENNPASDNNSVASVTLSQKSQDTLPGLDLLTPESTGNPPPTSFYGTMDNIVNDEPEQPYLPEIMPNEQWNSNWSLPPRKSPPRNMFVDTPESPPPAPPSLVPPRALRTEPYAQDLPAADVDHRGILPPPPPPPILPILGNIEDVDHRLLPNLPPPPPPISVASVRHPSQHQDVDHRNLIPLTHQPPPASRPGDPIKLDQDYRVPTMVPPPDIVESVDMDLSEDEEQQRMYPNQTGSRRNSFNNNKVLVGGDHSKNHETNHTNLIQINSARPVEITRENDGPHSAPIIPMTNPFDKMPPGLQFDKMPPVLQFDKMPPTLQFDKMPPTLQFDKLPPAMKFMPNMMNKQEEIREDNSNDNAFDEELRSRSLENMNHPLERHSPNYNEFPKDEWPRPRPVMGNRFPRNWSPRPGALRPNVSPQFWPRNMPPNRWMGPPRPQRFW